MTSSTTSATLRRRQAGITLVELLVTMTILTIVTTMIILGWFSLQSSYAQTVAANDARSSARDALHRMSIQIRSANAQPGSSAGAAVFTVANPTEVQFYSSFNVLGQTTDGSATAKLRLTRIYLAGTMPYQTLYLQRDTNNDLTWGSSDQQIVLASNVVNNSTPSTSSPTAIFTYGYRDPITNNFQTANTLPTSALPSITLASIISVNMRVMVDANLAHTPTTADLQTTVRPQNAPN